MAEGLRWRTAALARLESETFDALVVGAGATGAAVARDAALRGLSVALCDRGDFAGETSSYSSKLIHGGLRYLQYGDLPLVFEALAERRRLMTTAPHLCRPVDFLFPAYRERPPRLTTLQIGVGLYDALALFRPPAHSRRLSSGEVYTEAPGLRTAGLTGAVSYVDCQTDDARLVLETALDAEAAGAVLAPYVEVEPPGPGRRGAIAIVAGRDRQTGRGLTIRARAVVNATGPFSDSFSAGPPVLRPTLGVHLVFDARRLPTGGRAFVLLSPRDGRVIFTLPAGPRTIVGTTDTDWGPRTEAPRPPRPGDEVRARGSDVVYLLETLRHHFPAARLGPDDVISTFAGLRPLIGTGGATPSATSREHAIWVDPAGVLTIAGGKLTTMRKMGEEAVDHLLELLRNRGLDRPIGASVTATRPLPGGGPTASGAHPLVDPVAAHLADRYGSRAAAVLARGGPSGSRPLVEGLPYVWAEVLYAAREERVSTIEDVLRRRIPIFRDAEDQGLGVAEAVALILERELGWSREQRERSLGRYCAAVAASRRWREDAPFVPGA